MFVLDRLEPADTGSNEDPDVVGNIGSDVQTRMAHRKVGGRNRVLNEDVHLLDVLPIDELQRIKPLHLTRDLRRMFRRVEVGDGADAAAPGADRFPVGFRSDTDR